jgi:hypothetical protein
MWQVEHEPKHGGELRKGGHLAGPVRFDDALAREVVDQEGPANEGDVSEDDQGGKPQREMLPPARETECDDGGQQHQFVRQWVENGPEP